EYQINPKVKVSTVIMTMLKHDMIETKGALKEFVVKVKDTMVDSEVEVVVVDE
ncbi:hypothetical protein KI387_007564, partial [Taxus chinensis]